MHAALPGEVSGELRYLADGTLFTVRYGTGTLGSVAELSDFGGSVSLGVPSLAAPAQMGPGDRSKKLSSKVPVQAFQSMAT